MSFSTSCLSAKRIVFAGQKWNQRIIHKRRILVLSQSQNKCNTVKRNADNLDETRVFAFSTFGKTRSIFTDNSSGVYSRHVSSLISSHAFSTAVDESNNDVAIDTVAKVVNTGPLDLTDLSYWPIDSVVRLLDGIHTTTGLPWWLSIVALGVGVRVLGTPITVLTKVHAARLSGANKDVESVKDRFEKLKEKGAPKEEQMLAMQKVMDVYRSHGTHPFKLMGFVFMQIPFYSITFLGCRRLCENFSELAIGGDYWFTDLTVSDPTYGLAVMTSSLILGNILLGGEDQPGGTKEQEETKKRMKSLGMAMAFGIIPVNMFLPAGVMLYFASTSAVALGTSLMLKTPGVDRLFGFHPDSLPGVIASKSKAERISDDSDTFTYVAPHKRERMNRRRNKRNSN